MQQYRNDNKPHYSIIDGLTLATGQNYKNNLDDPIYGMVHLCPRHGELLGNDLLLGGRCRWCKRQAKKWEKVCVQSLTPRPVYMTKRRVQNEETI